MNNDELSRYSRHIMLPEVDYEGQLTLSEAHVLIIGAGGLGSPVAMYLASSGVGNITISDFDHVELNNLQRQILHATQDIGKPKADSAKATLQSLNDQINVHALNDKLDESALREQVKLADIVVEATDNFHSRFLLNRICTEEKTPLVSGSAAQFKGQVTTFRADLENSPCYHCLYDEKEESDSNQWESCTASGVLAPLVGIIGSIQAAEVLKILLNLGQDLCGRFITFDVIDMQWRESKLKKDPNCSVCR